jgi:transposase
MEDLFRQRLVCFFDFVRINPTITELTHVIEQEAQECPEAQRLMTHPEVGVLTALAFVLILGDAERFGCGKQIASYLGRVPEEDSSGERRRLGHISKQGNSLLRFPLLEAAQATVRSDVRWRNRFFHLAKRRGRHGLKAEDSFVLDVAQRMELRATRKLRFARATAWKSPWCAVNHRRND